MEKGTRRNGNERKLYINKLINILINKETNYILIDKRVVETRR